MLRIAGAAKPYKTLVKTAFAQVQNCSAQTLIKPVVYGGFPRQLAKEGPKIIEKHYVYKVYALHFPTFSHFVKTR